MELYEKNVNKGYMKLTFCFIILELLKHEELKDKDFEINLLNEARVMDINTGENPLIPDIYKDFLNEYFEEDGSRYEFRLFRAFDRKDDINNYEKLYADLTKNKNGRIERSTES